MLKCSVRRLAGAAAVGGVAAAVHWRTAPTLHAASTPPQHTFCWGKLVPGDSSERSAQTPPKALEKSPVLVEFWRSRASRVEQMSHGLNHAAALDSNGHLWAWGREAGSLPVRLPIREKISSLASTSDSLYAVTGGGRVVEWRDVDASLAHGATPTPTPIELSAAKAVSISAGERHLLIIDADGCVYGLGANDRGQLGVGKTAEELPSSNLPVRLNLRSKAISAACGNAHSIVALSGSKQTPDEFKRRFSHL